jgi:hypothetical protein
MQQSNEVENLSLNQVFNACNLLKEFDIKINYFDF